MRHPKDIAVSFFFHMRHHNWVFKESPYETFSEFLPYLTGEYGVCEYSSNNTYSVYPNRHISLKQYLN